MPQRRAELRLVLLAIISAALIYGAVTLPFLTIETYWISSEATLVGTALAFEGPLLILSLAVLCLILLLPALRLGLTLYVLLPIVFGKQALPGAPSAFRWSEVLRPWSMAEIFVIGYGVALAKIAAMVNVTFGPAFYMFAAAVVLIWIQDRMICRHSVWLSLEE